MFSRVIIAFSIGCALLFHAQSHAQNGNRTGSVLLVCRPIDAGTVDGNSKYQWLTALIDRQVRFKTEPVRPLGVVSDSVLSAALPALYDYRQLLDDDAFRAVAPKVNATHMLIHKFEVQQHSKTVNYYVEIVSVSGKKTVAQTEKDIIFDNVSNGIDSCLVTLCTQLNINLSPQGSRFLYLPVTGTSFRALKELGELFIKESDTAVDRKSLAQDYEKIINKDPFMLLANYAGGLLFFKIGNYEKSARYIKELLDLASNQTALYLTLCRSYRLSGRYNEALQVALLCEQNRLRTVPFLLEKALVYEGLKQPSEAFVAHQQVLMLDPGQPASLLFMAHLRNDERKYAEAKTLAEKLIKADPKNAYGHYEFGRALFGLDNYTQAARALAVAEELQPDDPSIQELLGDIAMIKSGFEQACSHYRRASVMRPRELDIFLKTANALESAGKKKEALESLYEIADRFPSKPQLRRQIGLLEYANGSLDSACRSLTMYLAVKSDDGYVLKTLGSAYMKLGNYRKSRDYYEKALPLTDDKIACRMAIAESYVQEKDHAAAQKLLRAIIAEKPIRNAHRLMAEALLLANNKSESLKEFRTERELHGNDSALQHNIAYLHYELGFYIPAKKEFTQLSEISPTHPQAQYYLALLALRSGEFDLADKHFSRAVRISGGTPAIFYEAGTLYRERKSLDNSVKAFKRCLSLDADYEPALRDLSDTYLAMGQDTAAAAINIRLFDLNNKSYSSYLAQAGHLYLKHHEESAAASAYQLFLDKGFSDFTVNTSFASILYKRKDYKKIISLLEKLSGDFANDKHNLLMLGHSYCETSQYAKALPWLSRLRKIDSGIQLEARLSAVASEKTGDTITAIAMYARLLTFPRDSNYANDAYHLGTLYEAANLQENAISRYEKNIQESPADLRSHERLGNMYMKRADWQNARRVLEIAASYPEVNAPIQKMLARTYVASNEPKKAAALYTVYLARVKDDLESWKELSSIYYSGKEFAEAIEPLKQVTRLEPAGFEGWFRLGASYIAIDNFTAAIAPLGRARAIDSKNVPAIELTARCYRHAKETSTLAALLREWISIDPRRYDIKMELGSILLDENEIAEAASMLTDAVRFIPSEAQPHLLLSRAYELQGNDSLRFVHLSSALKFGPQLWQTHYQIARYYSSKRLGHDAERHLVKAISINPSFAPAHYEYGSILIKRKAFSDAGSEFSLALETEPENLLYRIMVAYTECMAGNKRSGAEAAADVIRQGPKDPRIHYWAGEVYRHAGKKDAAREAFGNAIAIDSSYAECFESIGDTYMEETRFRDAARNYFLAWEKGGYDPDRVYKLGNALLYDRKFIEAKDFFETILAKNNNYDDAKYRLTVVYCELGDLAKARALIPVFQLEGTPWMQLAQGKIYETEGKHDAAITAYTIASKISPNHPDAAAGLGNCYMQKNLFDSAIVYLSAASAADTLNMKAMMDLGEIFEKLENSSAALQYYLEVDRKYPWFPGVQIRIAAIKSTQKAHETAVRYLERGLKYQDESSDIYFMLGKEYFYLDNHKEALSSFKTALKKGKGEPIEALRHIGNIYYDKLGDTKKARDYYKKYVKSGGFTQQVTDRLAKI